VLHFKRQRSVLREACVKLGRSAKRPDVRTPTPPAPKAISIPRQIRVWACIQKHMRSMPNKQFNQETIPNSIISTNLCDMRCTALCWPDGGQFEPQLRTVDLHVVQQILYASQARHAGSYVCDGSTPAASLLPRPQQENIAGTCRLPPQYRMYKNVPCLSTHLWLRTAQRAGWRKTEGEQRATLGAEKRSAPVLPLQQSAPPWAHQMRSQ